MKFERVISYLDDMVGMQLCSVNDSNDPIVIVKVDRDAERYLIAKTSSTKPTYRNFKELKTIWESLVHRGYISVEQALGGGGSSRHQPETILANLPFIEHFKYERKKHLYLRDENTHPTGTLKELSISESREVKRRIDKHRDFDISQFYAIHCEKLSLLKLKMNNIFTKFPGESDVDAAKIILNQLQDLETSLSEAIVNTEFLHSGMSESVDDSITGEDDDNDNTEDSEIISYEHSNNPNEDLHDIDSVDLGSSINKRLNPTRITQVTPTVSLIFDRVQHHEIDLQPDYQRKDRIWSPKDKARLIESILLGLPLPIFYFAERINSDPEAESDFEWVIIDGLQRITTLVDFIKGVYPLKELAQLPQYNLKKFNDLPRKEQRKIREYQIHGHLIQESKDSEEMIRELFHRINTYGKNLSYQEIRSALYPGSANKYCKYLAESDLFAEAIPAKINPDRMLDIEYVLRAIAYLVLGYESYNYKTNDEFLCSAMKKLNKYKFSFVSGSLKMDQIYSDIDYRLKSSFVTISKIFGRDSYKKEKLGKVNKIIFEMLVPVFGWMNDEERNIISSSEVAEKFKFRFFESIRLDENTSKWESDNFDGRGFDYSISNSTGKRVTVLYRFSSLIRIINEVSGLSIKELPLFKQY